MTISRPFLSRFASPIHEQVSAPQQSESTVKEIKEINETVSRRESRFTRVRNETTDDE